MDNIREKTVEILVEPCCGLYPARELADYLIANGVTVQEWIPVTERLPTSNTWVMVYRRSVGNMGGYTSIEYITFLHGGTTAWSNDFETWKSVVSHWMPLPSAPKGE